MDKKAKNTPKDIDRLMEERPEAFDYQDCQPDRLPPMSDSLRQKLEKSAPHLFKGRPE